MGVSPSPTGPYASAKKLVASSDFDFACEMPFTAIVCGEHVPHQIGGRPAAVHRRLSPFVEIRLPKRVARGRAGERTCGRVAQALHFGGDGLFGCERGGHRRCRAGRRCALRSSCARRRSVRHQLVRPPAPRGRSGARRVRVLAGGGLRGRSRFGLLACRRRRNSSSHGHLHPVRSGNIAVPRSWPGRTNLRVGRLSARLLRASCSILNRAAALHSGVVRREVELDRHL